MLQPAVKSRTNTPPTGLRPASTSAGRPLTADLRSVRESHSETSAVLLVLHLSVCPSCFRATVLWNILLLLVVSMRLVLTYSDDSSFTPEIQPVSVFRAACRSTSDLCSSSVHTSLCMKMSTKHRREMFGLFSSSVFLLWTSVISRFHYLHLLLVFSPAAQVCFTAN